jgi:hypothetical protein
MEGLNMEIDRVIEELKAVARAPELSRATISKGAALAALKAIRANQAIALVPIGRNWPGEAVRMREMAAAGLGSNT